MTGHLHHDPGEEPNTVVDSTVLGTPVSIRAETVTVLLWLIQKSGPIDVISKVS